jgi:hypothetical protein
VKVTRQVQQAEDLDELDFEDEQEPRTREPRQKPVTRTRKPTYDRSKRDFGNDS